MNNILGENIARLRKERGMTQEDLARELNISYQAVSKWENGVSSPDISNIKLLAQFFGVSIDMLFGMVLTPQREDAPSDALDRAEEAPAESGETSPEEKEAFSAEARESESEEAYLPWEDDNTLRAVLFRGRQLLSAGEVGRALLGRGVRLEYSGDALNVFSFFDVSCEDIRGNVEAGGDVDCDAVGGYVSAHGDVSCDSVGEAVNCGGDVSCDNVGGDIRAGGDVSCGDVGGSITAGDDVSCGDVKGNVCAGGDVSCGDVGGLLGGAFRK